MTHPSDERAVEWFISSPPDSISGCLIPYSGVQIQPAYFAALYPGEQLVRWIALWDGELPDEAALRRSAQMITTYQPTPDWQEYIAVHQATLEKEYPSLAGSDQGLLATAVTECRHYGVPLVMVCFATSLPKREKVIILQAHQAFRLDRALAPMQAALAQQA